MVPRKRTTSKTSTPKPSKGSGKPTAKFRVDFNCDMGEGSGQDKAILPFITSANISCGYHAGDASSIWQTIQWALQHKVAVGAHPSYLDRENFGRTDMELSAEELYDLVTQQLFLFNEIASNSNAAFHHVKPHGALYNRSAKDKATATTIAKAVRDFDSSLVLFGLSGSHSITAAKAAGLQTASEGFADRRYADDGSLVPRSATNAMIEDADEAIAQALQMIRKTTVTSISGKEIPLLAETICIHSDGEQAGNMAKSIFTTLKKNKIDIKAI